MEKVLIKSKHDLIGRRFGRLVVIGTARNEKKELVWECKCDCGNITTAKTGHLNSGSKKSCGCIRDEKQINLTGKRFGRLTVLECTDLKDFRTRSVLWKCQCDCGNECLKSTGDLNYGSARSCGCEWRKPAVKIGDRYGRLVALEPTEKRSGGSVVWKCICDCGNIFEARATSLKSCHVNSCGCIKVEADKVKMLKNLTYQDDTCIEFLEKINVPTKASSTGVRGVTLKKDGRYKAELTFRKKRYYLGVYDKFEDAVKARRQAETLVEEYLEQIKNRM